MPTTALKLPLVPSTHPRASNRRPTSANRCATALKSPDMELIMDTATGPVKARGPLSSMAPQREDLRYD